MNKKPACGPERDPEFFAEIDKVFTQYPEAARRYALRCMRRELEILNIDFTKQVGLSRIEDGRIITEFRDRDDDVVRSSHHACCEWHQGHCYEQCQE
ncbi:hypothetical protein [Streptomyces scabiei]|uniref:hypothetical protein n=1 Tax=Streptomyces scabiei TaxID=1930 RepID=UPI00068D16CC|nr:hypothetical protein [Streptomyces scabiei]